VEVLNHADTLLYTTDKALVELGDKITAEEREKVKKAGDELREVIKSDDQDAVKSKMDALTKEMSTVSTRIYQEAAAAQQAAQQAAGPQQAEQQAPPAEDDKKGQGGKGDFTDADYHIVD
jgi:molecular chaperone DnaK